MNPVFHGKVENDIIVLDDKERFRAHRKTLEGERIDLVLRKHKEFRSEQANRYYFGVVVPMVAEKMGHPPEEENLVHEMLKIQAHVVSTAQMSKKEFWDYVQGIVRFAAEVLQLAIPDPNEVDLG
jgi:hypothetical protein